MANPAWSATGDYFETCTCDYLCPCLSSNLTAPPTKGDCVFAFAFRVDRGRFGEAARRPMLRSRWSRARRDGRGQLEDRTHRRRVCRRRAGAGDRRDRKRPSRRAFGGVRTINHFVPASKRNLSGSRKTGCGARSRSPASSIRRSRASLAGLSRASRSSSTTAYTQSTGASRWRALPGAFSPCSACG